MLRIRKNITSLEAMYATFHSDWFWRPGSLRLARVGYARGTLVSVDDGEVGQLSLTEYYRRSALNTEEYYRTRFNDALNSLDGLLKYLRTAAALRTEQQAGVLNQLVLVLTITSLWLAALQVLGALPKWQNGKLILAAIFLVSVIVWAIILIANRRLRHQQKDSERAP